MEIYHYGKNALKDRKLNWTLTGEDGTVYRKGSLKVKEIQPATVDSLGIIELSLNGVESARKLTLKAELGSCRNEWDVWVYPNSQKLKRLTLSTPVPGMTRPNSGSTKERAYC